MSKPWVRLIRTLLLLTFLGCAIYGPGVVMSGPAWKYPWLQSLVAGGVCLWFLGMVLCFSICSLSGDISRSEERNNRTD
jgi:hypothetical protein